MGSNRDGIFERNWEGIEDRNWEGNKKSKNLF